MDRGVLRFCGAGSGKSSRATLLKNAKELHNSPLARVSADEVEVADGRLVLEANHQVGVAISEIMATAGLSSIEKSAEVGPDKALARKFAAYTHSAIFVEVKVDSELGVVRVTRVVSAVAAGRILNPKTARSQILEVSSWGWGWRYTRRA